MSVPDGSNLRKPHVAMALLAILVERAGGDVKITAQEIADVLNQPVRLMEDAYPGEHGYIQLTILKG